MQEQQEVQQLLQELPEQYLPEEVEQEHHLIVQVRLPAVPVVLVFQVLYYFQAVQEVGELAELMPPKYHQVQVEVQEVQEVMEFHLLTGLAPVQVLQEVPELIREVQEDTIQLALQQVMET